MSQTDSFAAFYREYPRKVARKAAEKAWARVATSPEVIEQIMAGLSAQLPGPAFNPKNRDKSFIPYPATWLNQRRWEDEQDAPKRQSRVIACAYCAGTGVMWTDPESQPELCDYCPVGKLPGIVLPSL